VKGRRGLRRHSDIFAAIFVPNPRERTSRARAPTACDGPLIFKRIAIEMGRMRHGALQTVSAARRPRSRSSARSRGPHASARERNSTSSSWSDLAASRRDPLSDSTFMSRAILRSPGVACASRLKNDCGAAPDVLPPALVSARGGLRAI